MVAEPYVLDLWDASRRSLSTCGRCGRSRCPTAKGDVGSGLRLPGFMPAQYAFLGGRSQQNPSDSGTIHPTRRVTNARDKCQTVDLSNAEDNCQLYLPGSPSNWQYAVTQHTTLITNW